VALGPRTPGSPAHSQVIDWMQAQNWKMNGWQVELQETTYARPTGAQRYRQTHPGRQRSPPWILLGAHFDSRLWASSTPTRPTIQKPVPGANDGASGVAVLLELARVLPADLDKQIWLVFFDAEDQGKIIGWDWILGSRAFAESLVENPDAMVLVDMIGDADLNIHYERNSDPQLSRPSGRWRPSWVMKSSSSHPQVQHPR
jgi:glutaminyl-peptide cyclotransferase